MATMLSRVLLGAFAQFRYEPAAKRVRAVLAGHTVVDTGNAYLVWEPRRITPVYAVPEQAGVVVLDFSGFEWLEDDESIIGHPRDPFHRVDIRASAVPVEVALDGTTLASTNRAALLYETMLPVRYYIPPADVRLDLLEESPKRTVCPYKGKARYYSYPGSEQGRNVAWSYDWHFRDAAQIHGLVSFYNERVDVTVGGVLQARPVSPWPRPSGPGAL